MQSAKAFEIRGLWFSWSHYDLLNGVIVPGEGAKLLEYDPWHRFRANAGKYRTVEQPYTPLLELHRHLKELEASNVRPWQPSNRHFIGEPERGPKNDADRLILDWCNQHGLLGLVPVLANSIRPVANIEPGRDDFSRVVKKRHHFRDGGIWHSWLTTVEPSGTTPDAAEQAARRYLDEDPKPGATWYKWLTHMYEEKPLQHIRDFFLPSPFGLYREELEFDFPCPNTRQFWESYGEPVWAFVEWCEIFASAVDYLSGWSGGKIDDQSRAVLQSHCALSGLAQTTAPSFRFNPERNTVDEERVSPGLLASYALMFLWDRVEGRRALRCQNCSSYFISNEHRARYCSPRCRNTAQSRRYRSKER